MNGETRRGNPHHCCSGAALRLGGLMEQMNARELFGSICTYRHSRLAGFAGTRTGSSACPHGQAGHFAHATLARRRPLCRMPAKSLTGRLSLRKPAPRRGRCQHCAARPERLDAELVSVNLDRKLQIWQ